MMQPRFERRQANTAFAMIEQPRFRAGFDFLRLRADVGEAPTELAEWWEDFSMGSDEEREALLAAVRESQRGAARKPATPKPARKAAPAATDATAEAADEGEVDESHDGDDADEATTAPARKRRRRRRKPAGGGGQGGAADGGAGAPAAD